MCVRERKCARWRGPQPGESEEDKEGLRSSLEVAAPQERMNRLLMQVETAGGAGTGKEERERKSNSTSTSKAIKIGQGGYNVFSCFSRLTYIHILVKEVTYNLFF